MSPRLALADAGYGDAVAFRDALRERGLHYIVGVTSTHSVWPPGAAPKEPKRGTRGRPPKRFVDRKYEPISIQALAESLPGSAFRRVSWREGSRGQQSSKFACVRVRPAEQHTKGRPPSEEHWLICEWPDGEPTPTKFHPSSLSAATSLRELVRLMKLRWRVERDYQELKGEIGLNHFEGRT